MNEALAKSLLNEVYSDPAFIDDLDRQERAENAKMIDELAMAQEIHPHERQGHSRSDEDGDIAAMKEEANGRHGRII